MVKSLKMWLAFCLAAVSLYGQEIVPNQMIIKTSQPTQLTRGALNLPALDEFLVQNQVTQIKPLRPIANEQYFVATFAQPLDWDYLQASPPVLYGVEYIQPNRLNQFYATPNDPYFINQQFGLVNIPDAWDITTGSNEVMVAVIDSGLSFDHPDLQTHIYYNPGEIADNGIDDDNNGYIDDWRGWDFVDAPEIYDIALGDYTVEDNDPSDENYHGTHVSGIICADANNNIGVCGILWNTKLLVIRAGFRTTQGQGYLQDDDCAASLIYAADMGADVINLSWGDVSYSQIIDDACRYAYDRGCIIVAAAGNVSSDPISYPARLATTIAVGSVDSYLNSAGNSTGPELDVVAPGSSVLSCWNPESDTPYTEQSGTSMAAPFVTGIVGLLLSYEPGLTFEEVRSRVCSTASDLGDDGFDNTFGWGLIDAAGIISTTSQPSIAIDFPADNTGVSSSFDVIGTVTSDEFFRYSIMYTQEESPTDLDWLDVLNHTNTPTFHYEQVEDGVLGNFFFEPYLADGNYLLRVQLTTNSGVKYDLRRNFQIDQTAPVLDESTLSVKKRYSGELPEYFLHATYDESVDLKVECRDANGTEYEVFSNYADSALVFQLDEYFAEGPLDIRLEAVNRCGLTSLSSWYDSIVTIDNTSVNVNDYTQDTLGVALVCLPPYEERNFVAMELGESYGPVHIYSLENNRLQEMFTFTDEFWPHGDGDTNGSGLEVLGIRYDTATLYETAAGASYPTIPLWNQANVLGGAFINYDSDDNDELVLVRNLTTSRVLSLYNRTGNTFSLENSLVNTTATDERNYFASDLCSGDFDNDGYIDILTADEDGDVMVFELYNYGTQYSMVWNTRLPATDANYLAIGDFDGDRLTEFCVGAYNKDTDDPDKSFWYFGFFRNTGNNEYELFDWLMFDDVESQNSIVAANIDDDINDELMFTLSPHTYIIDYVNGSMVPVWKGDSERCYQGILFAADSVTEMAAIVNSPDADGNLHSSIIVPAEPFTGPPTPESFRAQPVNESSISLNWLNESDTQYRIYRRLVDGEAAFVAETDADSYTDIGLTTGTTYEYAITAVNANYTPSESQYTLWKQAIPDYAPTISSITMISANRLEIIYDRALDTGAQNTGHYEVNNDIGRPLSVAMTDCDTRLVLTFAQAFPNRSDYTIRIADVSGATGVSAADGTYSFAWVQDVTPPTIQEITPLADGRVIITFDEALAATAQTAANYVLLPPPVDQNNSVVSVTYSDGTVTLRLASKLQVSNQPYYLHLQNISDLAGNPLRNDDDNLRFSLTQIHNLDYVKVAPNPLYTQKDSEIRFFDLPLGQSGHLWIYNLSGELVYDETIEPLTETQYYTGWNARNMISKPVSSGSYFYILKMGGEYKKGTISVIR